MAISTTAIDFGQVNVGSTRAGVGDADEHGGDPFGPINIFGGAPPTAEFNASQNCQANTLPAGGSCMVNYVLAGSAGSFNDTSSFTISETNSQGDGEDFSVSLAGVGFDPNATTTTTSDDDDHRDEPRRPRPTTTVAPTSTPTDDDQPSPQRRHGGDRRPRPRRCRSWPLTGGCSCRGRRSSSRSTTSTPSHSPGLNQADIVFEEIVEGPATRFAAVFNSMESNPVGPIRSARTQDVDLLLSLNDPAIAYSGANAECQRRLEAAGFELLSEGTPGFFRSDDRPAPHNLYANLSELFPQLVSSGDAVPIFEYVAPGRRSPARR